MAFNVFQRRLERTLLKFKEDVVYFSDGYSVAKAVDYHGVSSAARVKPRERGRTQQTLRLLKRQPHA